LEGLFVVVAWQAHRHTTLFHAKLCHATLGLFRIIPFQCSRLVATYKLQHDAIQGEIEKKKKKQRRQQQKQQQKQGQQGQTSGGSTADDNVLKTTAKKGAKIKVLITTGGITHPRQAVPPLQAHENQGYIQKATAEERIMWFLVCWM
jgi:hypothetical protein